VKESAPYELYTLSLHDALPISKEKRYAQDAVVALVHTDPPAASAAFERFTPEGPLALLPFAGRYAMVWSRSPEKARALAAAADADRKSTRLNSSHLVISYAVFC